MQLAWLGMALAACGGEDGAAPDGDAGPPDPTRGQLFGACDSDADCTDPGSYCVTAAEGYPGGFCTRACDGPNDRTLCEVTDEFGTVYHNCAQRVTDPEGVFSCEKDCLNGIDCGREGYTCAIGTLPGGNQCIPVCSTDAQCGAAAFCNPYTGLCQPEPFVDPTTQGLSITGGACQTDEDCASGFCVDEGTSTQPTGFINGYCVSNCILPTGYNTNNLFNGPEFPAGSCAGDDVICFPASLAAASRQDQGLCFTECQRDADCREGYECQSEFQLRAGGEVLRFDNGRCFPGDCRAGGVSCPSGSTCQVVQLVSGAQVGRCTPN